MKETTKILVKVALACLVALCCASCKTTSPFPYDHELGEWHEFDLVLSSSVDEPGPTVIKDCDQHIFVYSVAISTRTSRGRSEE